MNTGLMRCHHVWIHNVLLVLDSGVSLSTYYRTLTILYLRVRYPDPDNRYIDTMYIFTIGWVKYKKEFKRLVYLYSTRGTICAPPIFQIAKNLPRFFMIVTSGNPDANRCESWTMIPLSRLKEFFIFLLDIFGVWLLSQ